MCPQTPENVLDEADAVRGAILNGDDDTARSLLPRLRSATRELNAGASRTMLLARPEVRQRSATAIDIATAPYNACFARLCISEAEQPDIDRDVDASMKSLHKARVAWHVAVLFDSIGLVRCD